MLAVDTFPRPCFREQRDSKILSSCLLTRRGITGVLSYELNRQRNNRINGCNCRGIALMCVQCTMRTDDDAK